jgi:hypothetical protein
MKYIIITLIISYNISLNSQTKLLDVKSVIKKINNYSEPKLINYPFDLVEECYFLDSLNKDIEQKNYNEDSIITKLFQKNHQIKVIEGIIGYKELELKYKIAEKYFMQNDTTNGIEKCKEIIRFNVLKYSLIFDVNFVEPTEFTKNIIKNYGKQTRSDPLFHQLQENTGILLFEYFKNDLKMLQTFRFDKPELKYLHDLQQEYISKLGGKTRSWYEKD